jgi:hypothetical protein
MTKTPQKMVPFTNSLGITMMVIETEPTVEEAEYHPPIDHAQMLYGVGALAAEGLLLALPVLLFFT